MKTLLFFQIGLPAFSEMVKSCSLCLQNIYHGGFFNGEGTSVFSVGVMIEVQPLTLCSSCPHICSFELCTIKQNWTLWPMIESKDSTN